MRRLQPFWIQCGVCLAEAECDPHRRGELVCYACGSGTVRGKWKEA